MKTTINLNIERIVLHGLHQVDRYALAEALRQVLVEQLSLHPAISSTNLPRLRTKITLPIDEGADQLGQALGQSISSIIAQNTGAIQSGKKTQLGGSHDA